MTCTKALFALSLILGLALAAAPAQARLTCPQANQVSNQDGQWAGPGGWSQDGGLDPTSSAKIESFFGALYQKGMMICQYYVTGHYGDGKFAQVTKAAPGAPLPVSGIWECESWYRTNCGCNVPDPTACAFPQNYDSGGPHIGYPSTGGVP
ncbi:MAG: hypothetical protein K9K66_09645 [Desulfarculaceae bacterium]|nr:hypothetical protein [Desulfarculaceae bacterium]MCF8073670.1 hypothetical protein [Desulfarculaceae bacterium]MCF8101911.1 hypothetical protein [Desulfarculaceae bacterium]MCF8117666.1 hypothetical protein [Desulfarculaceae bacterium]